MSLSAGDQAQVIGVGVAGLVAFGAGVWRVAALRADMNARWASRVDLAVAALDARTIQQLENLRAAVDASLPEGEFNPSQLIADPAPLSRIAEDAVNLHRARNRMSSALARLLGVGRLAVGGLIGMLLGAACATAHYAELWDWSPLRLSGLTLLCGSAALLVGVTLAYVVLQDQLATAEALAGTAGQAP
jgi:hypothetical protein